MLSTVFERLSWWWCAPAARRPPARRRQRHRPAVLGLEGRRLLSVTINIDYSYDANNFFNTPDKRSLMQAAADVVASGLSSDALSAIVTSGGDTWAARFPNPATGALQSVANLVVPANTIDIYVGGRSLTDTGEAGSGSTGGYSATGDPAWLSTVVGRGDSGALGPAPSSFAPWGGAIAFDMSSTSWFSGTTTAGLTSAQTDFFTVAEHEIGHVLGIGTSASWFSHVTGDVFTGPASMAFYGGPVPLGPDDAHFAEGLQSDGTSAVMEPELAPGTRLLFTDLDYAGLADVGWAIQRPSPTTVAQLMTNPSSVSQSAASAPLVVSAPAGSATHPSSVTFAAAASPAPAAAHVDAHGKLHDRWVAHRRVAWSPRHKENFTITLGSLPPQLAGVV
jgi:hypothetical protein